MKIALIGCGYWGKNYVKTLQNNAYLELKYVFDINNPSITLPQNIIFTQNLNDILNDSEVEGVIIAIPTKKIFEVAKKCLEAGKNVLMEKPMTDSSQKANELIEIANRNNRILMIGHIFVYHPAIKKLKEIIEKGELGKILYAYSARIAPGPVRNSEEIDALWDLAPHDLSIFNYLFGKQYSDLRAFSNNFLRKDIIDSASVTMKFGDIPVEIHVRWWDSEKIRKITIIGERKIAVFDDIAEKKLKIYDKNIDLKNSKINDYGEYYVEIENKSALENQCMHFFGCIQNHKKPLTDGESGLNVVKILEEINGKIKNDLVKTSKMEVKFLDLTRIHNPLKQEIMQEIEKIIDKNSYILGEKVEEFENNFAKFHGATYGIAVDSGTSALELSLRVLGIGHGDEVILPTNTFIATASAVAFTGAIPVLVDCDENYNINPKDIENNITSRTKAIIPVHLYGQPADMDEINEIAKRYGLSVIEDACQAHGSEYRGRRVGNFSKLACFSFYPGKNLGGMGDGGIILTNDKELSEKLKMIRNYGQSKKYYHDFLGYNRRLDGIQATILNVKLKNLDEWNKQRRNIAEKYNFYLKRNPKIIPPNESFDRKHVYHLFVIRIPAETRDILIKFLKENGIDSGLHYPIPIHLQKAYKYLNYREGDFPFAEKYSNEILSLPMFPGMTNEEVEYVCKKINEFYGY